MSHPCALCSSSHVRSWSPNFWTKNTPRLVLLVWLVRECAMHRAFPSALCAQDICSKVPCLHAVAAEGCTWIMLSSLSLGYTFTPPRAQALQKVADDAAKAARFIKSEAKGAASAPPVVPPAAAGAQEAQVEYGWSPQEDWHNLLHVADEEVPMDKCVACTLVRVLACVFMRVLADTVRWP